MRAGSLPQSQEHYTLASARSHLAALICGPYCRNSRICVSFRTEAARSFFQYLLPSVFETLLQTIIPIRLSRRLVLEDKIVLTVVKQDASVVSGEGRDGREFAGAPGQPETLARGRKTEAQRDHGGLVCLPYPPDPHLHLGLQLPQQLSSCHGHVAR